jgi:carotenoid cleavage dioxygenase-like enzyme
MGGMETAPVPAYLEGNFAPVFDEVEASDLPVEGEIPRDLEGFFVRNGSNPRFRAPGRYHWFDGDGTIHAVQFEGGRASYRNRWVRTRAFAAEQEAGKALWTGVTERPDFTNPRGPFKDSANTDLIYHAGKLLALWWLGGEAYIVDLPSLETRGVETFGGKVPTFSAHPKLDPATGELLSAGAAAPARYGHHRTPHPLLRHVDDVGPGAAQGGENPCRVLPGSTVPHRRAAPAYPRGPGALVRGRALLHVPHGQRLGGSSPASTAGPST